MVFRGSVPETGNKDQIVIFYYTTYVLFTFRVYEGIFVKAETKLFFT